MERLPYLYYKGICSLEFCLLITKKSVYNMPERDIELISVPGRNGDLVKDNGRYKNISLPYGMTLVKKDNRSFSDLIAGVKRWLSGSEYNVLWDSYDPRYFRYAVVEGGLNIDSELRDCGEFTLNFNCKPYRYSFDGQKAVNIPAAGAQLFNPEDMPAKPYMKIYGNGDISVHINSSTVTFTGISEYIEIDSEIMNAYKGIVVSNNIMTGVFPELIPGINTISFTGNVSGAEIIPRWCAL